MKTAVNTGEVSLLAAQEAGREVKIGAEHGIGSEKQAFGVVKWIANPSDGRIITQTSGENQFGL